MTQRDTIYAELLRCPSTIEQLENILQWKRSTIRGRLSELKSNGDIKKLVDERFQVIGL